jgi:hypothetical protein
MLAGAPLDRITPLLELVRERRPVVRTDLPRRAEDRPRGDRDDPPVLPDRTRDDDMAVQMRVRRVARKDPARSGVPILGGHDLPRRLLHDLPAITAAHRRHRLGEMPHRLAHRHGVRGLHLPALGDRRLSEVQRRDVQDLADRLTAEGLSTSTVQNTLDPLRVIFRRAIRREEGIAVDPTEGLELRHPDGRRDRIADPAEASALIVAMPDSERALWACAFYAGLRRGELQALRWEDVDLAERVIRVSRGWDAIEGEQDAKSAAGNRRVPILDLLAGELAAHKQRTGRDGAALVFGPTGVKPFSPETVR